MIIPLIEPIINFTVLAIQGGGIPRKDVPLIWNYAFTTAEAQEVGDEFGGSDFKAPLAGYGYGLPIARLYAQYLGGNLKLISMQGYGKPSSGSKFASK